MDKFGFIEYTAQRYGIDFGVAETLVDMFSDTLQELLAAGIDVDIDGMGKFQTIPLFPNGLNHRNNIALARASKRKIVSFIANEYLAQCP